MKNPIRVLSCLHCGKEKKTTRMEALYCSNACKLRHWRERPNRHKNIASKMARKDGKKPRAISRHILKTITYRILGTLTTIGVSYYCTGSFKIASMLGAGELVLKPLLYFAHERVWYKFVKLK